MNVIEIGDCTLQEVSTERIFDPVTGPAVISIFEGSEDDCTTTGAIYQQAGFRSHVFQYNGPVYRLRVSIPEGNDGTPAPNTDRWERFTETAQEDIRNNPRLVAAILTEVSPAGSTAAMINGLYKDFKDQIKAGNKNANYGATNVQAFFELLSRGAEAHEVRRVILRRRRTIALRFLAQSEVLAVERIYSTSALISAFAIPNAIASKLPVQGDATPTNTAWGWKERSDDSMILAASSIVEETKEFVFAAWSTLLYQHIF